MSMGPYGGDAFDAYPWELLMPALGNAATVVYSYAFFIPCSLLSSRHSLLCFPGKFRAQERTEEEVSI